MTRRAGVSTNKAFRLVLGIAFGLIALVMIYAAFAGGLDLRSQAWQTDDPTPTPIRRITTPTPTRRATPTPTRKPSPMPTRRPSATPGPTQGSGLKSGDVCSSSNCSKCPYGYSLVSPNYGYCN